MGSWSELTIGEIVFPWKYHVPTFLTFVFSEDDLFIEREQVVIDPEDEEERVEVHPDERYIEKGGYRTTVGRAKAVLNEYGYTVPFFAGIYGSFRVELDAQVRDRLADELGQTRRELRRRGTAQCPDRGARVRAAEHRDRRPGGVHRVPARGDRDGPQDGAVS
jgi:hypothetical protein